MATDLNIKNEPATVNQVSTVGGEGSLGITLGIFLTGVFYGALYLFPQAWMQRYFLGHWVCVAATLLFAIAGGILIIKALRVRSERRLNESLRDSELGPTLAYRSTSDQWILSHDAGRVAKTWVKNLEELPLAARKSRLVCRLTELLERQSTRVSTRHLSDDLRELSARDGDQAHDSLQLVRIIVWAIPMLGFLGTVIGITETLGGLDFNNGAAAIEQLKKGLYVAFDTTAIGLVLSVVAIFLQYPAEKAEQQLLGDIDHRIGKLLVINLPADDASDNPAGQIAQLCDGIRVAVGESLASQTELWRQTIDEAHLHWQRIAEDNGQRIGDAIMQSLAPALREHAGVVSEQTRMVADQSVVLREQVTGLNQFADVQRESNESQRQYSQDLAKLQKAAAKDLDDRTTTLARVFSESSQALAKQQQALLLQIDVSDKASERTDQLLLLQTALDANLLRIAETNASVQQAIDASLKNGMSQAMMTLASAVEVLAVKLPKDNPSVIPLEGKTETQKRRAA